MRPNSIYEVTMWTYVAALAHFASEWLLFGSTQLGSGLLGPLIVARTYSLIFGYHTIIFLGLCSGVAPMDDTTVRLLRNKMNSGLVPHYQLQRYLVSFLQTASSFLP